jgi:hypothetical protein
MSYDPVTLRLGAVLVSLLLSFYLPVDLPSVSLFPVCVCPKSKSHCDWRSVSKSWCRTPSGAHDQIFITVWQLQSCFLWGPLSEERTGLSFVYAAGPCQRSLSWVRVPWYSLPYFTVSDLRIPFSSPPTTPRVTVEVFDPASTRESLCLSVYLLPLK